MQGFDNRKIAQAMELSVKTVENHLTSLYRSLAVESRLEATHFAMRYPEVLRDPEPVGPTPESKTEGVLTVLLVDDNPRYREQMARLIGKTHPASRVIEAGDIADALQAAERTRCRRPNASTRIWRLSMSCCATKTESSARAGSRRSRRRRAWC